MNSSQLDARMEYAESILHGLQKTAPTIAIESILSDYDAEAREEIFESIQAYADIRARQAIFAIYDATAAPADHSRDIAIEECAKVCESAARQMRSGQAQNGATVCATQIRALKSRPSGSGESP